MDIKRFLASEPGWLAGKVLDLRPAREYTAGHLAGACSFPLGPQDDPGIIPSVQLPPRHQPLLVMGSLPQQVTEVAHHLAARGRSQVGSLVWEQGFEEDLPGEWLAYGPGRHHLWEPPAWLRDHRGLLPPPAAGPVLDLGCGSGRAAVWLAQRGYRVTGIDWQAEALAMARELAGSCGVEGRFVEADLRDRSVVPAGPWSIILNFRFLERDLLEGVSSWLKPAGVCLVRTFRQAPGYEGHPQPKHRLQRGELLQLFPRGKFDILAHEEGFDADGRPAAGVVARRR